MKTVKFDDLLLIVGFSIICFNAYAQSPVPTPQPATQCACACENNVVKNSSFQNGTNMDNLPNWKTSYGSPDYSTTVGCKDAGQIGLWGNKTVGEAFNQTLSPQIEKGKTYRLSFSMKSRQVGNRPNYAQIKIRASNSALATNATTAAVVGITRKVTVSEGWVCITLPIWVADKNYSILTVSVENEFSVNDGEKTSAASIDNICLTKMN